MKGSDEYKSNNNQLNSKHSVKFSALKVANAGVLLIYLARLPVTFDGEFEARLVDLLKGKCYVLNDPLHDVTIVNIAFIAEVAELIGEDELHLLRLFHRSLQKDLIEAIIFVEYIKHLIQLYGADGHVIAWDGVGILDDGILVALKVQLFTIPIAGVLRGAPKYLPEFEYRILVGAIALVEQRQ